MRGRERERAVQERKGERGEEGERENLSIQHNLGD